jgi:hypothetical protein
VPGRDRLLSVIAAFFELLVEVGGRFLGAIGFERFVERDEANSDPRNFPPSR